MEYFNKVIKPAAKRLDNLLGVKRIDVKYIGSEFRPVVWRAIGFSPVFGPDYKNVNPQATVEERPF
jgi:hypothetical protein